MAYGATTGEQPVRHKEFQISVVPTEAGFEAWIERTDRGLVSCGYSLSQACGTHEYATVDEARAAAVRAINAGEVRPQP
jgi:hypothetical protein